MAHRPPNAEDGAPLHDLTGNEVYPSDVYTNPSWYSDGRNDYMKAWAIANRKRNNPNAKVRAYRAVPCNVKTIHKGDWVTTVRQYARDHGKHNSDPSKDMCVIMIPTRAKCLHTSGDSMFEWGYNCADEEGVTLFKPSKKRKKK